MPEITRRQLESIIGHVSQRAAKHWLKVSGLEYTATNTDEFYARLLNLIKQNKLNLEQLKQAALEIEESGGKRIYLRKITILNRLKSRAAFSKYIKRLGIALATKPDVSIKTPKSPILNYVYWSENEIRVKFSETHKNFVINYTAPRLSEELSTKFAIAIVDLATGFTQIRLDAPGERHPHVDKDTLEPSNRLYEEYYFAEFRKILGDQHLELYDLDEAAQWLLETVPRVYRLNRADDRTGANSRNTFRNPRDVRDDLVYQAASTADPSSRVIEDLHGYWIPEQSNGELQRELFMELKLRTRKMRFFADCLRSEVDYAIRRIREAEERKS